MIIAEFTVPNYVMYKGKKWAVLKEPFIKDNVIQVQIARVNTLNEIPEKSVTQIVPVVKLKEYK